MKDEDEIIYILLKYKLGTGTYYLAEYPRNDNVFWRVFAEIKRRKGGKVHGHLCCRICSEFYKFDGTCTSELKKHRCYQEYTKNGVSENGLHDPEKGHSHKARCESDARCIDEEVNVVNINGDNVDIKREYMEDVTEDIVKDEKVCDLTNSVSWPEESEEGCNNENIQLDPEKLQSHKTRCEAEVSFIDEEVSVVNINGDGVEVKSENMEFVKEDEKVCEQISCVSSLQESEPILMQECNNENIQLDPLLNFLRDSNRSGDPESTVSNLLTEVNSLKRKMDEEAEKNEGRYKALLKQNEMISQQLKMQERLIKRIVAQCPAKPLDFDDTHDLNFIPFRSIKAITEVEANLDSYPRKKLLKYIKLHLGGHGWAKLISILFTEELLLEINWDGRMQKLPLRQFRFFNSFVYEAIKNEGMTFADFETEMKRGVRIAKNYLYKKAHKSDKSKTAVE